MSNGKFDAASLSFENPALESHYRRYQFRLIGHRLLGPQGLLPTTSFHCSVFMSLSILEILVSLFVSGSPASRERLLAAAPFAVFIFYNQWRIARNHKTDAKTTQSHQQDKSFCEAYAIGWLTTIFLSETIFLIVNDLLFPEYQGCAAKRFRCPYSFCAAKISSRTAVVSVVFAFSIAPTIPFPRVVLMTLCAWILPRLLGHALVGASQLMVSLWSTLCTGVQICIFLGCRYILELQERQQFVVQYEIAQLRATLQEALDHMMPRHIAQRVNVGDAGAAAVALDDALVLRCAFTPASAAASAPHTVADQPSADASAGTQPTANAAAGAEASALDAMETFLLFDRLHRALDDAVAQAAGGGAFKAQYLGHDYLLISHPLLEPLPPTSTPGARAEGDVACVGTAVDASADAAAAGTAAAAAGTEAGRRSAALGELAGEMMRRAREVLAGAGMEARAGLGAGAATAAVIGESRRHLRLLGPAVDAAAAACALAEPWQVLASPAVADVLRASGCGDRLSPLGSQKHIAAAAAAATTTIGRGGVGGFCEILPGFWRPFPPSAASAAGAFSVQAAAEELERALGGLSPDGSFVDPGDEARYRLESASEAGSGGPLGSSYGAARTACVAVCQALFLLGLPGYGAAGWSEGPGWVLLLCVAAAFAALPCAWGECAAGSSGEAAMRRRWAGMHGVFLGGCVWLAWVRAEPFLLLGFSMGVTLGVVALPTASATAGRWAAAAWYAVFLGAFCSSAARDGLSQPALVAILPLPLVVHHLEVWMRGEAAAVRVQWLLARRRGREQAALRAALRDMLPEPAASRLGAVARVLPHSKKAYVLHAALDAIPGCAGGVEGGSGGGEMVRRLHELMCLFDREVAVWKLDKVDGGEGSYVVLGFGQAGLQHILSLAKSLHNRLAAFHGTVVAAAAAAAEAAAEEAAMSASVGGFGDVGSGLPGGAAGDGILPATAAGTASESDVAPPGAAAPVGDSGACEDQVPRLRIGVAAGTVVVGSLGQRGYSCHYLGPALTEAQRLAMGCRPGETKVQRSLSRPNAGTGSGVGDGGSKTLAGGSGSGRSLAGGGSSVSTSPSLSATSGPSVPSPRPAAAVAVSGAEDSGRNAAVRRRNPRVDPENKPNPARRHPPVGPGA